MELVIEDDHGKQYTVLLDLEDYLNDPKTIVKQVRYAYQFALDHAHKGKRRRVTE